MTLRALRRVGWAAVAFLVVSTGVLFPAADLQILPAGDSFPNKIPQDRGAAGLTQCLRALQTRASILMVTAHPDDEDGGMLTYETRGKGARGTLLTLNRGEGGQNEMSTDFYDALGLLRTQELLEADRYYGVDQYWTRSIDYGFSKTREEALQKWDHDELLGEVVRVIRMTRPLIITSVFVGAPTDGHGNHQVAGQMAQEAFVAAGDPNRYPEQIKAGLQPWSPMKVYCRVPLFAPTEKGMYDYATDRYVPIRFFDYVNRRWIEQRPSMTLEIPEGETDPVNGLTYLQTGREGLGHQKSQNGGITIPPPTLYRAQYHRYGSRTTAAEHEKSFFDGIDTSLTGIASMLPAGGEKLRASLQQISQLVGDISRRYTPGDPHAIAASLAEGLRAVRSCMAAVRADDLPEPGKSSVLHELQIKQDQFEKALTLALGLNFDATIAPDRPATGPFAAFAGPSPTFTIAVAKQTFHVQTHLVNGSSEAVGISDIDLQGSDGKNWMIKMEHSPAKTLQAASDLRTAFSVQVPADAALTKPYFSRPDEEQAFYNINDARWANQSMAPYPLAASANVSFGGVSWTLHQVVQTIQRVEGIGLVSQPLLVGPALSVQISSAAGAVPLGAKTFPLSCVLHSNVKGPAQGMLRLELPPGWKSEPAETPLSFTRDGENQTVTWKIIPSELHEASYQIKATAEYGGQRFREGYRLVGYSGLRSYPFYRPAQYRAVGVDVKVPPDLRVAFFPGTGDDVPQALGNLGLPVHMLSTAEIENGALANFDAVILGVRAFTVSPQLRAANDRLLSYVKDGGVLLVQYNLQEFDGTGPFPFTLGSNPQKVVDEGSQVQLLDPANPILNWPNKISAGDFNHWQEERGHGFMKTWDSHYQSLVSTNDPEQDPQRGGFLLARLGRGAYIYDAFALYRQLPAGVPGAYRILANLVSLKKNPAWQR